MVCGMVWCVCVCVCVYALRGNACKLESIILEYRILVGHGRNDEVQSNVLRWKERERRDSIQLLTYT